MDTPHNPMTPNSNENNTHDPITSNNSVPACTELVGSSPGHDDLNEYAIRNSAGAIIAYDVVVTHLTISHPPLHVPCNTHTPVTVTIRCDTLEICDAREDRSLPLICFNVQSGEDYADDAAPGEDGGKGRAGCAAGRLKLVVSGAWKGTGLDEVESLTIRYVGGHGGNGQTGGVGLAGADGKHGGVESLESYLCRDPKPEAGGNGGDGGKGGNAGEPGTIPDSEVVVISGKWPGWKVAVDAGDFGRPGKGGQGGAGGTGGKGSEYTRKDMQMHYMPVMKTESGLQKPDGKPGLPGERGQDFVASPPESRAAKVKLTVLETADELRCWLQNQS